MKKKKFRLLSILLVLTCMTGCAQSGSTDGTSKNVEICMHFAPGSAQAEVYDKIIQGFTEEHPEINVKVSYNGNENLAKVKTRTANSEAPDIMWTSPSDMQWFAQNDLLEPLDDLLVGQNYSGTGTIADDYPYQAVVDMDYYEGKLMALPAELCAGGWYYNKSIFEEYNIEVPETWSDLAAAFKTLKDNGIDAIGADGNVDYYLPWYFANLAVRLGGVDAWNEICVNEDSSLWDNPAYLKAAQMVETDVVPYFQEGMKGTQYPAANALFAQGQVAMEYCASWFPQEIQTLLPEGFEYGVFPFPEVEGAEETRFVGEMKANGYVLFKDSPNKEEAKLLLTYLVSEDGLQPLAELDMLPACKNPDVPEIQQETLKLFDTAEVGMPIHMGLYDPEIKEWASEVLFPANNLLCYGEITAEEFIEQVKTANDTYWASRS